MIIGPENARGKSNRTKETADTLILMTTNIGSTSTFYFQGIVDVHLLLMCVIYSLFVNAHICGKPIILSQNINRYYHMIG